MGPIPFHYCGGEYICLCRGSSSSRSTTRWRRIALCMCVLYMHLELRGMRLNFGLHSNGNSVHFDFRVLSLSLRVCLSLSPSFPGATSWTNDWWTALLCYSSYFTLPVCFISGCRRGGKISGRPYFGKVSGETHGSFELPLLAGWLYIYFTSLATYERSPASVMFWKLFRPIATLRSSAY